MSPAYRDLRKLHAGARFDVLRARRADGAAVVVKQVLATAPELRNAERLKHEYEILRRLHVHGVPRPLELVTIDERPALVLEDVGSHNLAERSAGGRPFEIETFLELATRMAEIVREIHGRSVIHRDICPDNFVLGDAPSEIALVDFESATAVPAFAETPGLPGKLEGSLAYMPPEQTGRMKRLVDLRADLYALGATFYEMLTGRPPFSARDPLELAHAHAALVPYPLSMINPAVPAVLSDIVLKLLAKMPEWRYQTAAALAADLREAQRQWRARSTIDTFELGRQDLPYGLLASDKLYGRAPETDLLERVVERATRGGPEVLLVTGPAGIGKSALIGEVRQAAEAKCRWIAGKGDQLRSNIPYAALSEALHALVQALLAEPEVTLTQLREHLGQAIAPNGRLLTDAIPQLKPLLGDQPEVGDVGATRAEARFRFAFTRFVRCLLAHGPPLVLFLDDLQWVDATSVNLLRALATEPEVRSLLIVCASRSEEIGPGHPLAGLMDLIRAAGTPVTEIELGPLDTSSLVALLSDTLRSNPAEVASLARVVQRKTGGNPFFVRQFLGYLYRKQLLIFSAPQASWTWDLPGIEAAEVTPNVVDLLSRQIQTLPVHAQRALQAAACIGNRFELRLLADLREESMDAAAQALWTPMEQGLIVPTAEGPRFSWTSEQPVELQNTIAPTYRFVHDRVQQAAYELLTAEQRKTLHLRLGRLLEESVPEHAFASALGFIVDQLDRAADRLSEVECIRLAHLNERAGRQARAKAAYASALSYAQTGLALLPESASRGELHALWFALQRDAAECASMIGDHELSERLVDDGISRTDVLLEKAKLYDISVVTNALRGAHAEAIRRGREGLSLLGLTLPRDVTADLVHAQKARTREILRLRSERQLVEAAPMDDPLDRAKLDLLNDLYSTWFADVDLYKIVSCWSVELTATRGLAPGSALAHSQYAIALAIDGDYREAYVHGRLAVRLAEAGGNSAEESMVLLGFASSVSPWRAPIADSVSMLQRAHARALESGELEGALYALASLVFARMFSGAPLDEVLFHTEATLAFYRRTQYRFGIPRVLPYAQAAKCLKGLTRGQGFDDDQFEEARFLVDARDNGLGQAALHVLRLQTCYLLGDPALAHQYAEKSQPWLPHFRSLFAQIDFFFYAPLALAALHLGASPSERRQNVAQMRDHLRQLEIWAQNAETNCRHKHDLVAAELARLESRPTDALALYHRAIEQAGRRGFVQDEALAHELCGRFYRARGAGRTADIHLNAALDGYFQWGASKKTELLEREFPFLQPSERIGRIAQPAPAPALDYLTLFKATKTFTEELALDRLLEKLLRTCAEAADAERGVLVLDDGARAIRATVNAAREVMLNHKPLAASRSLPIALVEHVFETKELLVLGNAAREARFADDPYVAKRRVRSVLAVPIVRGDRALGVLYFENNLTSDAFSNERAEMFRVLSGEIAVAIENSRLFEERTRSEAALRLVHRELQEALAQREDRDRYLRLIFTSMPGAAWAVDRELRLTYANGLVAVPDLTPTERFVGTTLYDILGTRRPDDSAIAHHLAALAGEPQSYDYQFRGRWFATRVVPLRGADGQIIGCVGAAFDVTEKRADEERLARSEARLVQAQRVAHLGSFDWEVTPNVVTWSDELHRIFGLEPGQFGGTFDDFLARVHPDDVDLTRRNVLDALRTLDAFVCDHRIIRADGRTRVLHTRGEVIKDAHGGAARIVGTCIDVTELKEATDARERSLSLLQATIEATADGILVVDRDGHVAVSNQHFMHMWGMPAETVEGAEEGTLLARMQDHVEKPSEFVQGVREHHARPESEFLDRVRLRGDRVFERYSRPHRIDGVIAGRVWSFRDISERELLLTRALFLSDATRLLASLDVEHALDAVARLAVAHFADTCAIDLFADGDPRRHVALAPGAKPPASKEVHPTVLAGHSIIYQARSQSVLGVPLLTKGKLVGAFTFCSLSDRRYTEADLELARELASRAALTIDNARLYRRAQEALRARDEFLSIAAHEIRGPVNAIHLSVQSIRQAKAPPEMQPKLLDLIERQDRRLAQFVNELLDVGRIRAGRLELEYEEVDLLEIAQEVAAQLGLELARTGSTLTIMAQGSSIGQWDRSRVEQVVTNLLTNAMKFGLGKPIEVTIRSRDDRRVELAVRDHGIGIEPELRERIFKPFERGISARHYGGLGLGLHIVSTIVAALGGSISIESEPGEGSTFVIELPRTRTVE